MNETQVREQVRKIYKKIYQQDPTPEQEQQFAREVLMPELEYILNIEPKTIDK